MGVAAITPLERSAQIMSGELSGNITLLCLHLPQVILLFFQQVFASSLSCPGFGTGEGFNTGRASHLHPLSKIQC